MEELEIVLEKETNQEQEIKLMSENITYAGGTSNYLDLNNKPSINGIELERDKTTEDLGIIADVKAYIDENKEELKGKDGIDGKDGQDGYTPIKGVDYFDGKDYDVLYKNDANETCPQKIENPMNNSHKFLFPKI